MGNHTSAASPSFITGNFPLEIRNKDDAARFDRVLRKHQEAVGAPPLNHLSLEAVHQALIHNGNGGQIFSFALEIQIQFAFLNCDLCRIMDLVGEENLEKVDPQYGHSDEFFVHRVGVHQANSNFVFRYRAIWDKIMCISILLLVPDEFQRFMSARSRKRSFGKVLNRMGMSNSTLLRLIEDSLTEFDQRYRTGEAHGSGTTRKWSYSADLGMGSPQADMHWAWNDLNGVIAELGNLFRQMASAVREC